MSILKDLYLPPCIKEVEFEVEYGFAWSIGDKSFGNDEGSDLWE